MTEALVLSIITLGVKYGPGVVQSIRDAFAAKGLKVVVADLDALILVITELHGLEQAEKEAGVKVNPDGSVTGGQV